MGVPQIGCGCAVCRSTDPRDQRTRTSALVESGDTTLLIDTPPELRLQVLRAGVDASGRGALHARARRPRARHRRPPELFAAASRLAAAVRSARHDRTSSHVASSTSSMNAVVPMPGNLKAAPDAHRARARPSRSPSPALTSCRSPFEHGPLTVYGYRIGPLAYITDVKRVRQRGDGVAGRAFACWCSTRSGGGRTRRISRSTKRSPRRGPLAPSGRCLTHLTHETGHRELLDRLPAGCRTWLRRTDRGDSGMTIRFDDRLMFRDALDQVHGLDPQLRETHVGAVRRRARERRPADGGRRLRLHEARRAGRPGSAAQRLEHARCAAASTTSWSSASAARPSAPRRCSMRSSAPAWNERDATRTRRRPHAHGARECRSGDRAADAGAP